MVVTEVTCFGHVVQACMADCKLFLIPLDVNAKLSAQVGDVVEDVTMYKKIVGSLIYLTIMRPDLSYTVGLES